MIPEAVSAFGGIGRRWIIAADRGGRCLQLAAAPCQRGTRFLETTKASDAVSGAPELTEDLTGAVTQTCAIRSATAP